MKTGRENRPCRERDTFFLVGLFPIRRVFRAPIAEILEEMPLSDDVKEALIHYRGPMGEALSCLKQLESAGETVANLRYGEVGISDLANLLLSASAWAQQAMDNP